tara:strand:- start:1349 stop:1501 length:153 start_codon:yes stop_codon:yes gene_type:complete
MDNPFLPPSHSLEGIVQKSFELKMIKILTIPSFPPSHSLEGIVPKKVNEL